MWTTLVANLVRERCCCCCCCCCCCWLFVVACLAGWLVGWLVGWLATYMLDWLLFQKKSEMKSNINGTQIMHGNPGSIACITNILTSILDSSGGHKNITKQCKST